MKSLVNLFVGICLFSCEGDFGHRVIGDNLTVHYNSAEDEQVAERIAVYWRENDLIIQNKQDLQLVHSSEGHELRVITTSPSESIEMPFNERKLLIELQKDLTAKLKVDQLQIVICNSKFEPLYNINK